MKNSLKDFRGKVFVTDSPDQSPSFYTGFGGYVTKNSRETTLDPYVFFNPKTEVLVTNKIWNVYASDSIKVDLKRLDKDIKFTKNFREYDIQVRNICESRKMVNEMENYLKIAEKMDNRKIDVDDIAKNRELQEKMKTGDIVDILLENI